MKSLGKNLKENNLMFVIRTHKGYLVKSNRGFTTDINEAKLFNTERSARAIDSMAFWESVNEQDSFEIVPVKVTVEKITD